MPRAISKSKTTKRTRRKKHQKRRVRLLAARPKSMSLVDVSRVLCRDFSNRFKILDVRLCFCSFHLIRASAMIYAISADFAPAVETSIASAQHSSNASTRALYLAAAIAVSRPYHLYPSSPKNSAHISVIRKAIRKVATNRFSLAVNLCFLQNSWNVIIQSLFCRHCSSSQVRARSNAPSPATLKQPIATTAKNVCIKPL